MNVSYVCNSFLTADNHSKDCPGNGIALGLVMKLMSIDKCFSVEVCRTKCYSTTYCICLNSVTLRSLHLVAPRLLDVLSQPRVAARPDYVEGSLRHPCYLQSSMCFIRLVFDHAQRPTGARHRVPADLISL